MGRMEQVHARALQIEWNRQLLADRIAGRGIQNQTEVLTQVRRERLVSLVADYDVLGRPVEAGEVPQQVPDIRTDSEITQLAGIDRYPHVPSDLIKGECKR